jgi:hypothetical protein
VLASHGLAEALPLLPAAAGRDLPGVSTVLDAWADRAHRQRGLAAMLDTSHDIRPDLASLAEVRGLSRLTAVQPGAGSTELGQMLSGDLVAAEEVMFAAAVRTLTVALAAARLLGTYHWEQPVNADDLVTDAAWDCFPHRASPAAPARVSREQA